MTDATPRSRFALHLDPTITYGHIITTAAVLASLVVWGVRLEGRVNIEEKLRENLERQWSRDQARDAETFGEIKSALIRIEQKIDGKQDRGR